MSTIFINTTAPPVSSYDETLPAIDFKGAPSIVYVLTGINEGSSQALSLDINWGDESQIEYFQRDVVFNYRERSIFNEVLYGKVGGSILDQYSHTYVPGVSSFFSNLTAQFLIYFSNGFYANLLQPIRLIRESYYDSIQKLGILNTQMIGTSASNTVANLQSKFNKRTYTTFFNKD